MTTEPAVRSRADLRTDIVEAAAQLLQEQGAHAVTTRGVAERAGVQAPTIYRLFGDKDGLVDAVAEHVMATYVATKAVALDDPGDPGDPVADLRAAWQLHVEFGLTHPELFALLSAPGRDQPSPATAAGIELLRNRVRRLATAGLLRVDERRAVLMIHAAGTGTVLALADVPAAERDLGLADAMFDALISGLLTSTPALPDPTVTAVSVAFAVLVPDLPGLSNAERTLMTEWLARSLAHLRTQ